MSGVTMCDSSEELVGDFEEIEGDAVVTEVTKITERKNTSVRDIVTKSGSTAAKRKSSDSRNSANSLSFKAKRVEPERKSVNARDADRNLFSAVQEQGKMSGVVRVVDEKVDVVDGNGGVVQEVSEEELLALDSSFAEDMFERISAKLQPKAFGGYRTKVRVSPVMVLDIADPAMQRLVKSQQPNVCFCFKGQAGKFRKKKGYAEIHVEKDKDWYTLLHHLCQVKFVARRVKVTVSIIKVLDDKLHAQGSFVLRLSRQEKIAKLLKAVKEEDARPINKACFLLLPEVPADAPLLNLRHFFPFLPTTATDNCVPIKSKPGFKGPVRLCYRDLAQVESVSDCFTDFTVNGQMLKTRRCNQKEGEEVVWSETEGSAGEEWQTDTAMDETGMEEGGIESATDVDTKMDEEEKKEDEEEVEEDNISSMARDLCSDMRESLNKLKQMETDDPNIQKILEFQAQLAQLQKTLSKPGKKSAGADCEHSDPWTLTPTDTQKPDRGATPEKTAGRAESGARGKKSQLDTGESGFAASVQEEMKALKEQEEKRRSNWAKKMIEDVKQYKPSGQGTGKAAKLEAQKLLQAREERLRQKKEEEDRQKREEEAAERQRKAEEVEKKRQEKDLKEGIAQIVLPFQDAIATETVATAIKSEKGAGAKASKPTSAVSQETKREPEEKVQMIWESIYLEKVNSGRLSDLPTNFKIRLRFYENRGCPVKGCPNKRYFKKREEFVSHWQIFHQENLTVRFCPRCSAYFANVAELEDHLRSRHLLGRSHVEGLLRNARQKVIRNPSYRDPGLYTLSA